MKKPPEPVCRWDRHLRVRVHRFPPGKRTCQCGKCQVPEVAKKIRPGWYGRGMKRCRPADSGVEVDVELDVE